MRTIKVSASKSYDIMIGSGILPALGETVAKVCPVGTAVVVSDSNVCPIYGKAALDSLAIAGFKAISYVFPAGEQHKSSSTYLDLLDFLATNHVTRSDCLIALGGGVVGDLTGFTAATFLRGIRYVQVPTTLLAAVDSSVGGKTAIDLPAGKNLVGAFCQPALVLCDIDTLNSLPEAVLRDGCGEIIKYGILYDEKLFAHLEEAGLFFHREQVIARCVELKRDVVMEDEFDNGARQKLNLGHTIGHGIEACSQFSVSHGNAVAAGMAIVARAGAALGICSPEAKRRILNVLVKFNLPITADYSPEELYRCALSDKKRSGETVNLIVPQTIGNCIIHPVVTDRLLSFIEAGI